MQVTYRVLPTSKDGGMVEFVPHSETLYNLQERRISILNWILDNNPDVPTAVLRQRIVNSTAANVVITYLLGIGPILSLHSRKMNTALIHSQAIGIWRTLW